MKLVIDGKEIVPVRLVPFITCSIPGLNTLPGILSNRLNLNGRPYDLVNSRPLGRMGQLVREICGDQEVPPLRGDNLLHAYRLDYHDVPVKMLPQEWDKMYTERRDSFSIHKDFGDGIQEIWRLEVSKRLPLGVFIWKVDLELLEINSKAHIKVEYKEFAYEGFGHLLHVVGGTSPLTPPPPSSNILKPFVERVVWGIRKKATGPFPKYKEVIEKLRHMVEIEMDDQAVTIIASINDDNRVSTKDGKSYSVKTIKHWLTEIRKKASVLA